MFFRQRWKDTRLSYQPSSGKPSDQRLILSPELSKQVWKPDIYFRNSKEARFHLVPTENFLFGISPDGSILLSARYVHAFNWYVQQFYVLLQFQGHRPPVSLHVSATMCRNVSRGVSVIVGTT